MKKLFLIILTGLLNFGFFSCTPETLADEVITPQACCGEDGELPPPPPPPPPSEDDVTGG